MEVGEALAKEVVRDFEESEGSFWDKKTSASTPWSDTIGELPHFQQPLESRSIFMDGFQ